MAKTLNLEDFRVPTEMQEELQRKQKAPKAAPPARIKRTDAFAMIPLWWAARAVEGGGHVNLMVCVDLVHRAWRAKGKTFTMPSIKGVDRHTKIRTLCRLEKAGLITVEWRRRKSPVVTLTVSIF